jgi:ribosome-binding factor A
MSKPKEPSQRQLRVGEEIRHILADIFMRGDFNDPLLHGQSITVTEVDVAPDMRNAIAYVSFLGGTEMDKATLAALNDGAGEFNHQIAKKMAMKFTPRIKFKGDDRFDYAEKIEGLLKKI